jgi:hypothetical protein
MSPSFGGRHLRDHGREIDPVPGRCDLADISVSGSAGTTGPIDADKMTDVGIFPIAPQRQQGLAFNW